MNGHLPVIREAFGRVVHSHKTHEKAAEICSGWDGLIKWVNIILTSITATSIISVVIYEDGILKIVTSIISLITVGFTLAQLSFNPSEEAAKHRQAAKELWFIRERYENLLSDIINKELVDREIINKRDKLMDQLGNIYKFAPQTNSAAYKKAQEALKYSGDMTFTNQEINAFLPKNLHIK